MIEIKCRDCGKIWKGKDEHQAEVNADMHPCKCSEEASKMTKEELEKKLAEQQKEPQK